MILEAAHLLKTSCNLTVRVFDGMDETLFRKGLEILFEDKLGYPRFSGDNALVEGFTKNGYDAGLARERIAVGCSWMSLPGREYTLNDLVKINMAKVFEVSLKELFEKGSPSISALKDNFHKHLARAVKCTAAGIDFHLDNQFKNEPELLLNLLSHGPLEKGRDVSHGGAEFYNMCIDGAGLAVAADSFAAIEQRIEKEKKISWKELKDALDSNFSNDGGVRVRNILRQSEKFGQGNSIGDRYAKDIAGLFTRLVKSEPISAGRILIPGFFSWADTVRFGKSVGATPNGRMAETPISHGANPNPGFRKDGALTALVKAVADIQPGYGNTAPLQLEIDMGAASNDMKSIDIVEKLLKTHFRLGGSLVNINIIDAEKLRDAHKHPEKYPDLTVRVTGFSAYFASLSREFRQLVVDRIVGAA
jgi:formate C-acetyltransferase